MHACKAIEGREHLQHGEECEAGELEERDKRSAVLRATEGHRVDLKGEVDGQRRRDARCDHEELQREERDGAVHVLVEDDGEGREVT